MLDVKQTPAFAEHALAVLSVCHDDLEEALWVARTNCKFAATDAEFRYWLAVREMLSTGGMA